MCCLKAAEKGPATLQRQESLQLKEQTAFYAEKQKFREKKKSKQVKKMFEYARINSNFLIIAASGSQAR